MMEHLARIKKEDRERGAIFADGGLAQAHIRRDCDDRFPEHSMAREKGDLPVEGVDGSIMNENGCRSSKRTFSNMRAA